MRKIYSNVDNKKLLHIIHYFDDIVNGRDDICPSEQFIQCAALKLQSGTTFKPHKHIWKTINPTVIAQESWCIIRGSVKVQFYDLDDTLLCEEIINSGDATYTFEGGHNYVILEENTIVREYKTGPYMGIDNDKIFLNGVINDKD